MHGADRGTTVVPEGFKVTYCSPRVARGAHKARKSGGGVGAAASTPAIFASGDRRAMLARAAKRA